MQENPSDIIAGFSQSYVVRATKGWWDCEWSYPLFRALIKLSRLRAAMVRVCRVPLAPNLIATLATVSLFGASRMFTNRKVTTEMPHSLELSKSSLC